MGDLTGLTRKELKGIRNVVRMTCVEVEDKLREMGLGLRDE